MNLKNEVICMDKKIMYLGVLVVFLAAGWLVLSGSLSSPGKSDQGIDSSLERVKAGGRLVVAINTPYEPLEYFDGGGNMVGLDVDIAREIASELGVSLEIRNYGKWEELLDDVKNGHVDLGISGISITPERSEEMLFSIPYLNNGMVLLARGDNEQIQSVHDLKGRRIGGIKESTWEKEALKYTDPSLVVAYDDPKQMLVDLKNNEIDAIIYDYVLSGKKEGLLKNEESIAIVGEPFTEDFFGVATSKNNKALMDEVNKILAKLKRTGRLKEIIDKWI